ncbi:MAG: Gfo/Idh/MocA family oxidoreductase [Opitutales bacterium]|jgi:predicted dehydrogenase|nr:Gfo/Idh/MocA family oxidoreductase [Opitutales bacterium]
MPTTNRRQFLKQSALGASLVICGTRATHAVLGANDRMRIAVVGLHGRGKSHVSGWLKQPGVEIAYLVDPDADVLAEKMEDLKGRVEGKFTCKGVSDIRTVLDDPNVDAVSIATPNHWHSLMTIWAAQAGKHVYVEKPMSHDVNEGRIAVAAQEKYGVVIQHGTQRRSEPKFAGLTEMIQAGKFGRLKISYGYCCKPRDTIGFESTAAAPKNLDWDLWRGPANLKDYHANFVHYDWHWFWATGNGDMNNQGTHQLDVARWALDPGQTHPTRVMGMGGRFKWNDQGETPNTMFAAAEYPNGQQVFFNVRNVNYEGYEREVMNEYYFEDGGYISREKYFAPGSKVGEPIDVPDGKVTPGGNWGAFVAACRAGKPEMANGNVLDAHYGCVMGHLMNNSYRLGSKVPFNKKAGRFGDNTDAYEHFSKLHGIMKKGVGLPEDGTEYTVGPWLNFDAKKERHTGEFAKDANKLLKDKKRKGFRVPSVKKV